MNELAPKESGGEFPRNEHMTRFLHTGDRQLGMTRHFFSEGVQERFAQCRFNVLRGLRITWINSPRARSQEKYGLYWNRNRE
jgi:hypothetical protein